MSTNSTPMLDTNKFRWVNCKDMAARSIKKVQDGELKLIPSQFDKTW